MDGGQYYHLTVTLRVPQGRPEDLRLRPITAHPTKYFLLNYPPIT
jgi:hypothetical protein